MIQHRLRNLSKNHAEPGGVWALGTWRSKETLHKLMLPLTPNIYEEINVMKNLFRNDVFDVENAVFDVENAVFDIEKIAFDVESVVFVILGRLKNGTL